MLQTVVHLMTDSTYVDLMRLNSRSSVTTASKVNSRAAVITHSVQFNPNTILCISRSFVYFLGH